MVARSLPLFALGALVWISTPAAAGSCAAPCVAPIPVVPAIPVVVEPASYVTPIYIVNQGPVYGGPGIVTGPKFKRFNVRPAGYPYVSRVIYAGTYFYYYPTYDAAVAPIWPRARHGWRW